MLYYTGSENISCNPVLLCSEPIIKLTTVIAGSLESAN